VNFKMRVLIVLAVLIVYLYLGYRLDPYWWLDPEEFAN